MASKAKRVHRPRKQTAAQVAEEKAIQERFQQEKPSLQDLLDSGDIETAMDMGEYWELRKTFGILKALRESLGVSITDMSNRTGMDRAAISRLENGHVENPTIETLNRYARALGKRVVVGLVDDSDD